MGEYIMSLICAGVLCSVAEIISPQKWSKYIKLFTGVIIAVLIISPVRKIDMSMLDDLNIGAYETDYGILKREVKEQLAARIEQDIEKRIKDRYGLDSDASAEIETDSDGNIKSVLKIEVKTSADSASAVQMLCEVYGLKKEQVRVYDG